MGTVMGKIRDGQMVETYNQWDFLGLVESMGATSTHVHHRPREQRLLQ